MIIKQCISVIVSISLLTNQMLFAGSLDLDKSATQKTSLDTAANGVPIVNITTPNAQGLSHNKFTNYNVEQKGLILNNATNVVQTQLGGYIASNPNLSSQSAKTILNEVTGTSRSLLNGYTEVAGAQADVIIANPNGISINGGGFINTPKVTLTTGKPELLNGQVSGFDVAGGDILIEGEGFNAAANSQVDLYAKVLTLNAKLHAQSLNIVTGENQIASDGTITSKQAVGTGVSLDSSALGGIYAQRITLVGTDKGVGVNLPPEVLASNGNIDISVDGKISFQKTTASQSIKAVSTSSDITINGSVSSSSDITFQAKESIINNDVITAGLLADGSANTASTLALQASSLTNNKSLYANGAMSIDASSYVENKDTINTLETLHVKANSLQNSGTLLSDKDLSIEAQTNIVNDGTLSSNKDLTITAQSVDNKGFITTADTLTLASTSLLNTGTINSNQHLNLTLNSDFSNDGTINSGTDATLLVNGAFINNNTLSVGLLSDGSTNTTSTLTLQSSTLTNNAKISSLGDLYINTATLTNKNYINTSNILYTLADTLNNSGTIYSNAYLIFRITHDLTNNGTLSGGKSVDILSNGTLTNNSVISSGLLSDGTTNNAATLSLQASTLNNTAKISSRGSLNVTTSTLANRGYLSAYDALHVNATTLHNYGVLFSGTNMNLWVSDLLYNYENANILAFGNLFMAKDATLTQTKRIVNDKATIETINGSIDLYAETFENKTDGLVKGTNQISSQTLTVVDSQKVDGAIITSVKQKLISEGKGQTLIGVTTTEACTAGDSDGCTEYEIQYGGISEKQVVVTKSYNIYWDTLESSVMDGGDDYIVHHVKQVYDIQYISNDDMIQELNTQSAKYGLSVSYGSTIWEQLSGVVPYFQYHIPDLQGGEEQRRITVTTEQEYVVSQTRPAKLLSGGKLSINAGTITNYLSQISSNDDMKLTGTTLNNAGEVLFQIDTKTGQYRYCYKQCNSHWHNPDYTWGPLPSSTTYTQTYAAYSTIYSAKSITGNLATVNNIDIKSDQAPLGHSATTTVTAQTDSIAIAPTTPVTIDPTTPVTIDPKTHEKTLTLPTGTNGLFVVSTDPKSKYLVETNPAFASFSNFISSDYMLSRLGYNADATTKRLGDAFYENQLVRDSIFEQTGKRYLSADITSDTEQYQYLMDNALTLKDELKLTPYVRLTADQIAALTKDIVWMEEREVDGQKVLVPVVYIANAALAKTTDNGAKIIAANNINLSVDTLTNQGDIKAGGDVSITASKNIYNEGGAITSGENMTLQAGSGIYNISSDLSAKALSISAETFQSDIDAQTLSKTYAGIGTQTSQLLSDASTISATDSISIKTTKDLSLIGTTLNAGGDVTLASTEGNIIISSKTHTDTYDFKTRNGYGKGTSVHEVGSSINANTISISSDTLLVNASDVTAQNDMNIKANTVAITAGEDRTYTDTKYEVKGSFMGGGKKTADTVDKKEVISSTLNAKNLNIDTKTLSIQGSKLTAEQATIASEVIELISLKNSDYESHFSDTSGLMTRTIASKGHIKEEVVSALIQVQNQLIVNNKDITAQLQTDNLVKTITSQSGLSVEQIKLVEAYAQSEEWNKKVTSLTGMGSLIIAAIVTVCTMGAGAAVVGLEAANAAAISTAAVAAETGTAAAAAAAASAASAATTATIQAAVVQSIVTQVANALLTGAITGNNPNLDMASIVKGAVLAGVLTYTSPYTNLTNYGFEEGTYTTKMTQAVVNASVKTAITGDSFKENLVNEVGSVAFNAVGHDLYNNSEYKDILPPKTIVQGLVGGALAELQGGDFTAGAISTATSHVVAEYMLDFVKENLDPNNPPFDVNDPASVQKYSEQLKTQIKAVSSLVGGTVALATNKDLSQKDLDIAQSLSDNVQENNVFFIAALVPELISAMTAAMAATGVIYATKDARDDSINNVINSVFNGEEQVSDYKEAYIPKPTPEDIQNDDNLPELTKAKAKTPVQGGGGLRPRWKDDKGNIYEWDSQHGEFEIYNKQGKHKGSYNPTSGEKKPAVEGREVEK